MDSKELEVGDEVTFANDYYGVSGVRTFKKGQKATVRDLVKTSESWLGGAYHPPRVYGIYVAGISGMWTTQAFEETKHIKL